MRNKVPTVGSYMSSQAYTIGPQQALREAHDLMTQKRIHHLPVLDGGKLVGIVTMRDVDSAREVYRTVTDSIRVDFVMALGVYAVAPTTPLDLVADHMAGTYEGAAVVIEENKVVGIFTMVDACRALRDALRAEPPSTALSWA